MLRKFILILIIVATPILTLAQESPKIPKSDFSTSKDGWKAVKKGNKFYKKGMIGAYSLAAEYYNKALEYSDMSAPLLYRTGICELKTGSDKMALRHLGDANDLSASVATDCPYWLAICKQHLGMFQEAKKDFEECLNMLDPKTKKYLGPNIQLRMIQCDNGLKMSKLEPLTVAQPLNGTVNTPMPEFAPMFSNLDSAIYFGSRRAEGNCSKKRGKDYYPNSDIFAAFTNSGVYDNTKNAGKNLNTKKSEYPAVISLTGLKMYFSRNDKTILASNKRSLNSNWGKASKYIKKATSVSFSQDSSMIIFTSRKGKGLGGSDIYFIKRRGKKYTKPENLGNKVNTKFDEEFATFGSNDTVIYFATNNHISCGEFDIVKSSYRNGRWSTPVNMGLGINSGADDNYFSLVPGSISMGYHASRRNGGKGDYDIYKILLLDEPIIFYSAMPYDNRLASDLAEEPILRLEAPEPIKTMRLTVVKGRVTDFDKSKNLYSQITITDNENNKVLQTIMTDPETGEFLVTLPSGKNYAMTVTSEGHLFHSENFNIPQTTDYQEIRKDIGMLPMDPGSKVVLNNVFFDTGSNNLRSESFGELDRLAAIFHLYPSLVIEVSGHTDNLGNRTFNITLSQQRADEVRKYLIDKGVSPAQVVAKGYGPDFPRDSNATEIGRQNNRRVEAKILNN